MTVQKGTHRLLSNFAVAAALGMALPSSAQDDGFTLDVGELEVKDESQARVDAAKDAMRAERYADALLKYDEILADEKLKDHHAEAQYDSAKALFRMGMHHAALKRYVTILDAGPSHPFYTKSRDWLFFIARKVDDRLAVIELIARYTKPEDVPPAMRNEFNYQLARYYFDLSLNAGAQGVSVELKEESTEAAPSEDGPGDVFDFGEEELDSTEGEGTPEEGDAPAPDEGAAEGEGDDFDFSDADLGGGDDDGFDFDFGDDSAKDKPKKTKKKRPKKAKPKSDPDASTTPGATSTGTGEAAAEAPKDETPPP